MESELLARLRPRRRIDAVSAVLMPMHPGGGCDVDAWEHLLERTWSAGLTPAVNMDTGFVGQLSAADRAEVLRRAGLLARGRRFVAGAFIEGEAADPTALYLRQVAAARSAGAIPILFPSTPLKAMARGALLALYQRVATEAGELWAFELADAFAPFGVVYDLETFRGLLEIAEITGLKHSSLNRRLEWDRLRIRDAVRPGFRVYTGNDLAIDLVMWGSDYLLGLSAFHPEAFAARDALWEAERPEFHELNDWLQYLGMFAFRPPVPAYRHTCAQVLQLRGVIPAAETHPSSPRRPERDVEILGPIVARLDELTAEAHRVLAP
jgi:dihydrodipicolinate synthase/N-acetylneuraminate lyase